MFREPLQRTLAVKARPDKTLLKWWCCTIRSWIHLIAFSRLSSWPSTWRCLLQPSTPGDTPTKVLLVSGLESTSVIDGVTSMSGLADDFTLRHRDLAEHVSTESLW